MHEFQHGGVGLLVGLMAHCYSRCLWTLTRRVALMRSLEIRLWLCVFRDNVWAWRRTACRVRHRGREWEGVSWMVVHAVEQIVDGQRFAFGHTSSRTRSFQHGREAAGLGEWVEGGTPYRHLRLLLNRSHLTTTNTKQAQKHATKLHKKNTALQKKRQESC